MSRRDWLALGGALLVALLVRLGTPSPDLTVRQGEYAFFMDNAGFLAWAREISEATSGGLSVELVEAARSGDEQALAEALLRDPNNLSGALLYGLYDNPIHVTRLADVVALAGWLRLGGYGVGRAELLMVLLGAATVGAVYLLARLCWRDPATAAVAALFMAILPGAVESARWISWHVMGQLVLLLALAVGIWGWQAYGRGGGLRFPAACGLAWGASLYTNLLMPALVPLSLTPLFLSRWPEGCAAGGDNVEVRRTSARRRRVTGVLTYMAAGLSLFVPAATFLALRWGRFAQRNRGYFDRYVGESGVPEKLLGMLAAWLDAAGLLVLALCGVGLWLSIRRLRAAGLVPAVWVAGYVLFSLTLGEPQLQKRVALAVLPAIVLLAALGFTAAAGEASKRLASWGHRLPVAAVGAAVLLSLGARSLGHLTTKKSPTADRVAVESLARSLQPGDVVVSNRPAAVKVLGPPLGSYTVISAASLLSRDEDGGAADYLSWRFPGLQPPLRRFFVLLSRSDQRQELGDEQLLAVASRALLQTTPGGPSVTLSRQSYGTDVALYRLESANSDPGLEGFRVPR
jgi:hypothetical protein